MSVSLKSKFFQRSTLMVASFVLAISSLSAAMPLFLSQNASAVDSTAVHATNLANAGWSTSESRSSGNNELVPGGLHVWTEPSATYNGSSNYYSKAAGYHVADFKLADAGDPSMDLSSTSGVLPSLQLGVDINGDGTWDGYLVYEPTSYGVGNWWTSKNFGLSAGGGYTNMGTLKQYSDANSNAKVISVGYSLGSGVIGSSIINKISAGGVDYTFDKPALVVCTYDFQSLKMWEVTWGYDFANRDGGTPKFTPQSNGGLETINGNPKTWNDYHLYVTDKGADMNTTYRNTYGFQDGTVRTVDVSWSDVNGCQTPAIVWGVAGVLNAENFNTVDDSSYKGISVGFNARDFGTVSSVTVDVTRSDGSHAVKHGTQNLFNQINSNTSPYQFTTPFVIQSRTYNPASDTYWTSDSADWNASTIPTGAKVTITGSDGAVSVTNTNFNQGAPSWPSYADMVSTTAPVVSNISITPIISDNIGGIVTVTFDASDLNGVDLTKSRVFFSDGPNTTYQAKESSKYAFQPSSGNTYTAVIDTRNFVKPNYTGNYSLAFNLYDTEGNHTSTKPSAFRGILIDNSGPSATLITPTSSVVNGSQRFSFNIVDDTQVTSAYVKFNGPTTKQFNLTHGVDNEWYVDIDTSTALNDGSYTLDVRPIDAFGTARYNANRGQVVIDNKAPDSPSAVMKDANGNVITNGYIATKDFTFDLTNSTTDGAVRYQLQYSNNFNGVTWNPTDLSTTGHMDTLSVYTDNFTQGEGTHSFAFSACDAVGNCSAFTTPFTVTYDKTAPVVTINTPTLNTDGTYSISGTTTDATSPVAVTLNGTPIGNATISSTQNSDGTTWNWNADLGALTAGETATVIANSKDQAGNVLPLVTEVYAVPPVHIQLLASAVNPAVNVGTTTTPTGTDNGQAVLGAQTNTPADANQKTDAAKDVASILGDSTSKDNNAVATIFGLAWYWWLLIVAALAAIVWWIAAAMRRRQNEQA